MNTNMLIDFIIDDLSEVCYADKLSFLPSDCIKKEVRLRYGIIKNGKSKLKREATDVLYIKSSDVRDYIYLIIEAFLTMDETSFNYSAYEYCGKRLAKKNTEHWFMHKALSQMMKNKNAPSSITLCYLLRSLLITQYETSTSININRVHSYVEKARENCLRFHDTRLVNDLCDAYINEIDNLWEQVTKEG